MKYRKDFVTNSSSTSFVIHNRTNEILTLTDFVIENRHLIDEYNKEYSGDYKLSDLIKAAEEDYADMKFEPKSNTNCTFGDEDGNPLGCCYDYILREGGSSKSFSWSFDHYCR
jgi:hypothetical protein